MRRLLSTSLVALVLFASTPAFANTSTGYPGWKNGSDAVEYPYEVQVNPDLGNCVDGVCTITVPTPAPTRTPPFPVDVSDSSAGTADAVGVTRVNILAGTNVTTSCAQSGSAANCTVNAGNAIGSSFDLNVELTGTDSASCGPINAPCASATGANGAFAKILTNNDNGFATCSTNKAQGCGRCTTTNAACNENSDCGANDVCTANSCSTASTEACAWTCSTTTSRKCIASYDCPPSETCNTGASAWGTCAAGSGTCAAANTNSRCTSGGCEGDKKFYNVKYGAGRFFECFSGSTAVPSPGNVLVSGAGLVQTSLWCGQSSGIMFDQTNRFRTTFRELQLTGFGNADVLGSIGNTSLMTSVDQGGVATVGTGWPVSYTGRGNQTITALNNSWLYGLGSTSKGIRMQSSPNQVCKADPTRPCLSATNCTGLTPTTCVSRVCANDLTTVCSADADCSGGAKCTASIKSWFINTAAGSMSSGDLAPAIGSFLQPGGGGEGACIQLDALSCGNAFNIIPTNSICKVTDNGGATQASFGIKLTQQSCADLTDVALRDRMMVQLSGITVNGVNSDGGLSPPDRSIHVGTGTTGFVTGPFEYDASTRFFGPSNAAHAAGKLVYVDEVAGAFGGGDSDLGSIGADAPRSQSIGTIGAPTLFGDSAVGSCSASTQYCYKAAAATELGEGPLSNGACYTTSAGSNNKRVGFFFAGFAPALATKVVVYRSTTLGGTYTKICDCAGCPACPTNTEHTNTVITSYNDTCVGTPSGSHSGTDQSWAYNSLEGERWYSMTLNRLRANQSGAVVDIMTALDSPILMRVADSATKQNDTTLSDDSVLAGFVLEANVTYRVEGDLLVTTGTTPDIKLALQGSTTTTCSVVATNVSANAPSGAPGVVSDCDASPGDTGGIDSSGSGVNHIRLSGYVSTGATGGTLDLQWAQNASNSTGTTVKAGSVLGLRRQ